MGVGAGLYMYDVVVKKFTFAIASPDEFLVTYLLLNALLTAYENANPPCIVSIYFLPIRRLDYVIDSEFAASYLIKCIFDVFVCETVFIYSSIVAGSSYLPSNWFTAK